jgi:hypothetical protein
MCGIGKTPEVPTIPERQAVKAPDQSAPDMGVTDRARRRRGMMASILTSAQGATGAVSTTLGGG